MILLENLIINFTRENYFQHLHFIIQNSKSLMTTISSNLEGIIDFIRIICRLAYSKLVWERFIAFKDEF